MHIGVFKYGTNNRFYMMKLVHHNMVLQKGVLFPSHATEEPPHIAGVVLVLVPLCLLPGLITNIPVNSALEIVARLLEVELGDGVVGKLAGRHEPANLALAQLLVLALDGPRGEADAALVVRRRDDDGLARQQQVVAVDVVGAAERILRHAVPQRQREDAVVLVVEKVQRVVGGGCLFVVAAAVACPVRRRIVCRRRPRRRLSLTLGGV